MNFQYEGWKNAQTWAVVHTFTVDKQLYSALTALIAENGHLVDTSLEDAVAIFCKSQMAHVLVETSWVWQTQGSWYWIDWREVTNHFKSKLRERV